MASPGPAWTTCPLSEVPVLHLQLVQAGHKFSHPSQLMWVSTFQLCHGRDGSQQVGKHFHHSQLQLEGQKVGQWSGTIQTHAQSLMISHATWLRTWWKRLPTLALCTETPSSLTLYRASNGLKLKGCCAFDYESWCIYISIYLQIAGQKKTHQVTKDVNLVTYWDESIL